MKKYLFLFSLVLILNSCFPAYKIYPKTDRKHRATPSLNKVYVINKGSFPKEYKILKHSNLFVFTNDSLCNLKIKLHPLEKTNWFCGQLMTGTMATLGQLPAQFPDKYLYTLDLIQGDSVENVSTEIEVHQHLWFWNIFSNKKNFKKQAGIALGAKYSK